MTIAAMCSSLRCFVPPVTKTSETSPGFRNPAPFWVDFGNCSPLLGAVEEGEAFAPMRPHDPGDRARPEPEQRHVDRPAGRAGHLAVVEERAHVRDDDQAADRSPEQARGHLLYEPRGDRRRKHSAGQEHADNRPVDALPQGPPGTRCWQPGRRGTRSCPRSRRPSAAPSARWRGASESRRGPSRHLPLRR